MLDESIKTPPTPDNSVASPLNYIGLGTRIKFGGRNVKQDKVTFNHEDVVTIYFAYEINLYPFKQGADFMLGNCLFEAVKLTKNTTDFDKYKYFRYGIGFDARRSFLLSDRTGFGKNVRMFGDDMSSSMHVVNRKRDILILGKGLMILYRLQRKNML